MVQFPLKGALQQLLPPFSLSPATVPSLEATSTLTARRFFAAASAAPATVVGVAENAHLKLAQATHISRLSNSSGNSSLQELQCLDCASLVV